MSESRVYTTRQRIRADNANLKYDDIFSSVVKKVNDTHEFNGISRRLIQENTVGVRARYFSLSIGASSDDNSSSGENSRSSGRGSADEDYEETTMHRCVPSSRRKRKRTTSVPVVLGREEKERRICHDNEICQELENEKIKKDKDDWKRREKKFTCNECSVGVDRHMQLHRHLLTEHPLSSCPFCRQSDRILRHRHVCRKCGDFAVEMNHHLIWKHYAQSQREGALLECGKCSRTFTTLREVQQHERRSHTTGKRKGDKKTSYTCRACGDSFASRHLRDQHFTSHFQSVIESVWETIEKMQNKDPLQIVMNQCPLCLFVMSSRKSFRTHIIHRHLIYDATALDLLVGPEANEEEIRTVKQHIESEKTGKHAVNLVKGEVKEMDDSGEGTDIQMESIDDNQEHIQQ